MIKTDLLSNAENELRRLKENHDISPEYLREEMIQLYYLSRTPSLLPTTELASLAKTFIEWESDYTAFESVEDIARVAEGLFEDILFNKV